jgi:hypothetical protein
MDIDNFVLAAVALSMWCAVAGGERTSRWLLFGKHVTHTRVLRDRILFAVIGLGATVSLVDRLWPDLLRQPYALLTRSTELPSHQFVALGVWGLMTAAAWWAFIRAEGLARRFSINATASNIRWRRLQTGVVAVVLSAFTIYLIMDTFGLLSAR